VSDDVRDMPPLMGVLMGTVSLGGGLAVILIALDRIHVDPSHVHAPPWVLGVCGGMFALPGAWILYRGLANAVRGGPPAARLEDGDAFRVVPWLIGMVISGGMTAVAGWVAFGPGERHFSGGAAIGPLRVGGSSSGTLGRAVFGVGAVLAGAFTVWGVVYGIRRLAAGAGRSRPGPGRGERR